MKIRTRVIIGLVIATVLVVATFILSTALAALITAIIGLGVVAFIGFGVGASRR